MTAISASDAKRRIGELWACADKGPVIVVRIGEPRYLITSVDNYVATPKDECDRLRGARTPPRPGFAKELFAGADIDAILQVDIEKTMRGRT